MGGAQAVMLSVGVFRWKPDVRTVTTRPAVLRRSLCDVQETTCRHLSDTSSLLPRPPLILPHIFPLVCLTPFIFL